MVNFSKYLGKEERVLNFIDMKDETVWSENNMAAAEFKSWTTLVITNKRLFSVSTRSLYMKEFRLEDIVSTGWIYRPMWGKIMWAVFFMVLAALTAISTGTIVQFLVSVFEYLDVPADPATASFLTYGVICLAALFGLLAILTFISYFHLKRTTMSVSTKDGKEYMFLLRGRRRNIDEFRMAIQDAKDLYLEETENRYFDKMRTVLFDQSNYEYALNNARPNATPVGEPAAPKLDGGNYMLFERKNAQINGGGNAGLLPETTMRLNPDGTLMMGAGSAYQLTADDKYLLNDGQGGGQNGGQTGGQTGGGRTFGATEQLTSSEHLVEAPLFEKAADLFKQMGFDVSKLNEGDADLLLYKDNLRYIVVVDGNQNSAVTPSKIDSVVQAKNLYKTDFGLFISSGDLTPEVQDYANKNDVKVIYIQKAE